MHATYGNGGPPKGKGRGKSAGKASGKQSQPVVETLQTDTLESISAQVARVLPQAAVLRAQSELLQAEWDAEVKTHQSIDSRGGISLVPKSEIPSVVQRIAYTTHPTAILISEQPDRVGLRGFPRKLVSLQLSVMGPDGQRQLTQVERYLVQMSYGDPVNQKLTGIRVQMLTTTVPMIIKLPVRHGWAEGPIPGSIYMHELTKYVPAPSVSEPRDAFHRVLASKC